MASLRYLAYPCMLFSCFVSILNKTLLTSNYPSQPSPSLTNNVLWTRLAAMIISYHFLIPRWHIFRFPKHGLDNSPFLVGCSSWFSHSKLQWSKIQQAFPGHVWWHPTSLWTKHQQLGLPCPRTPMRIANRHGRHHGSIFVFGSASWSQRRDMPKKNW